LVTGLLINGLSDSTGDKNYNPAFISMGVLIFLDLIVSTKLKVRYYSNCLNYLMNITNYNYLTGNKHLLFRKKIYAGAGFV